MLVGYCMSDFKGQTIEPTNEVNKAEIEWKQIPPREQRIQSHDAYCYGCDCGHSSALPAVPTLTDLWESQPVNCDWNSP
jgi:hypothetical protein